MAPSPTPQRRMSLMGHLDELRVRLVRAAVAVAVGMALAFVFSEDLVAWLARPLTAPLVFITPAEAFWANLKVAFLGGLLMALPAVLYQAWKFLEPGLYPQERRLGAAFIGAGTALFAIGVAFCAWVVFPYAMGFLLTYKTTGLSPMLAIGAYVDFAVKFHLGFGIIFELPPVMTLLARLGIVTPEGLSRQRKYAVLGAFIVAAILTPTPDIFNQCLMAVPLMLLYELGIVCARMLGRRPATTNDE